MQKTRKRKGFKIILGIAILLAIIIAGHTAFTLHPGLFFRNHSEIDGLIVYSESSLIPGMDVIIAQAQSIIEESAIYSDEHKIRIIISKGHYYNRFFGRKELAYATHYNAVLAGNIDLVANTLYWGKGGVKLNLTSSLAHEMVHCLQGQHHGFVKNNIIKRPPIWKKEGYAEYVSQSAMRTAPGYSLSHALDRLLTHKSAERVPAPGWITLEDGFDRPLLYFRARLMVEYLLDIQKLQYVDFMAQNSRRGKSLSRHARVAPWDR